MIQNKKLQESLKRLYLGYKTANKYIKNKDAHYMIVDHHIGEAVAVLSLLHEYKRIHKINKLYILTIDWLAPLAKLWKNEIDGVITISTNELEFLLYYMESDFKASGHQNLSGISWGFKDGKCFDMLDIHLSFVYSLYTSLGISLNSCPSSPLFYRYNCRKIQDIITNYKIQQNKSVILAPYTQTFPAFPNKFWIQIISILRTKGYQVFINTKDESERTLEGATSLSLPLNLMPTIVRYAGNAITSRSGLSDLLTVSGCRQTVLYYYDGTSEFNWSKKTSYRLKLLENKQKPTKEFFIEKGNLSEMENFFSFLDKSYSSF